MDKQSFFRLIDKYLDGTASDAEKKLVEEYYRRMESMGTTELSTEEETALRESMYRQVRKGMDEGAKIRTMFKRYAVAASIILAIGLGSYFLFFDKPGTPAEIVRTTVPANDIKAPGTNRAMITLADGRTIYLDSAGKGTLASQSGINVIKLADGKIVYQGNSTAINTSLNTLHNPRGSKVIDMTLADGSRVWLNAGSSVTYPVSFAGNQRNVTITGEAYFEVAHDASKPFIVRKGDMDITVLGTRFNVSAYDDEEQIKVTLLEGKVLVSNTKFPIPNSKFLNPGQQAILSQAEGNKSTIQLINPDLESVMAWKNGKFLFNKTDVQTAMRQIERWYDVEIEYQGDIKGFFSGSITRQENASQVLKILEMTGEVRFEISGKKIIVKP